MYHHPPPGGPDGGSEGLAARPERAEPEQCGLPTEGQAGQRPRADHPAASGSLPVPGRRQDCAEEALHQAPLDVRPGQPGRVCREGRGECVVPRDGADAGQRARHGGAAPRDPRDPPGQSRVHQRGEHGERPQPAVRLQPAGPDGLQTEQGAGGQQAAADGPAEGPD